MSPGRSSQGCGIIYEAILRQHRQIWQFWSYELDIQPLAIRYKSSSKIEDCLQSATFTHQSTSFHNNHQHMAAATWEEIGRQKREAIAALLPKRWRLQNIPSAEEAPNAITVVQSALSNNELRITEKSATQLLQLLATGELSAVEVFEAFAHRATIAHQLVSTVSLK